MNCEKIMDAMNGISEEYLQAADRQRQRIQTNRLRTAGLLAACLCVVVGLLFSGKAIKKRLTLPAGYVASAVPLEPGWQENGTSYADENGVLVTGWQEIEDNTYYFDETCNYVTGEQIIEGEKYRFSDKGILIKEP